MPESALGEEAFSVFCDVAASSLGAENDALRQQNDSLAPIYEQVKTFKIISKGETVVEINLESPVECESNPFYQYRVENAPAMSLTEFKYCHGSLFGAVRGLLPTKHANAELYMTEKGENCISYDFAPYFRLHAVLENLQGSLEDIEEVTTDQFRALFSSLREPTRVLPRSNEGDLFAMSSCRIHKVCITKNPDLEALVASKDTRLSQSVSDKLYEMKKYIMAYPSHAGIAEATDRHASLSRLNTKVMLARSIYATVNVQVIDATIDLHNSHIIKTYRFDLAADGTIGEMVTGENGYSWTLQKIPAEEPHFSTLSFAGVRFVLGGISTGRFSEPVRAPGGFFMTLDSALYSMEARFLFSGGAETLGLGALYIRLDCIKSKLITLGIDVDSAIEQYEAEKTAAWVAGGAAPAEAQQLHENEE